MQNLSGDKDCDKFILEELHLCGIDAVNEVVDHPEVKATYTGKLGPYRFVRHWYYWSAKGMVPLEVALELYADPVGKTDIRVEEHCGCPAPEYPWIIWVAEDGRKIYSRKSEEEYKSFLNSKSESMRKIAEEGLKNYHFADDPSKLGKGFITYYHIDTEVGLRLFADTIKKHNLHLEKQDNT